MKHLQKQVFRDLMTDIGVLVTILCHDHHITTEHLHLITGLHPRRISEVKKGLRSILTIGSSSFPPSGIVLLQKNDRRWRDY